MKKIVLLIPSLFITQIFAGDIPPSLIYNNKPIDPLCFFEAEKNKTDLRTCGVSSFPGRKTAGQSPELVKKGYYGYDYTWSESNDYIAKGYSYYRFLGTVAGTDFIYAVNNSGGSGNFMGIYAVKRNKNDLSVMSIMSGDRCNNGVTSASIENGILSYGVNVTAADFPILINQTTPSIKAYDDLAACAACCSAIANFTIDLNKTESPAKLIDIDFGSEKVTPDKGAQGKYQFCFDTLELKYQNAGKSKLNENELKTFMQEFNKECVKG